LLPKHNLLGRREMLHKCGQRIGELWCSWLLMVWSSC